MKIFSSNLAWIRIVRQRVAWDIIDNLWQPVEVRPAKDPDCVEQKQRDMPDPRIREWVHKRGHQLSGEFCPQPTWFQTSSPLSSHVDAGDGNFLLPRGPFGKCPTGVDGR